LFSLHQLYEDSEIIKIIKAGRLRWLGHLYRANETDPCRKVTLTKIEGRRKKGRPPIRWLDSVEQDLRVLGIRGWRNKAQERSQWKSKLGRSRPVIGCGTDDDDFVLIRPQSTYNLL
jgi:hypothetical protein